MTAQCSVRAGKCERREVHTGPDTLERGDVFQPRLERTSGISEHDDLMAVRLETSRQDLGDDVKPSPFRTRVTERNSHSVFSLC